MSLMDHLREPGPHGHLPFRRDCTVCTGERLQGTLPPADLVSTRATAIVVAGTLATGSALPVAAGLLAPASAQADAPAPSSTTPADGAEDGPGADGQDAGDESVGEIPPSGTSVAPVVVDTPDGPVTPDPPDEADAPPAPASPDARTPPTPSVAPPSAQGAPTASAPAPPAPMGPAGITAQAPPAPAQAQARPIPAHPRGKPVPARGPAPRTPAARSLAPLASAELPAAEQLPAPAAAVDTRAAAGARAASNRGLPRRARTYTVKSGDSLWSIARRVLGPRARDGDVAKLVARIWDLNAGRIGTGTPDLLLAGQTIALPRVPA